MHGFGEEGKTIFDRLAPGLPADAEVVAPDGPFILVKKSSRQVAFAWYFYDAQTDTFLVDYQTPADMLKNFVESFVKLRNLNNIRVTIIGYSQGGYLSLFAASKISFCDRVVGINASWREDKLEKDLAIRIDSLNGEKDSIVDPYLAKKRYQKLCKRGVKGSFHLLKGEAHDFSEAFVRMLYNIL